MDFSQALKEVKQGNAIQRRGWNDKGMFVYLVPGNSYPVNTEIAQTFFGKDALVPYEPYFALKNVTDTVSTWVPSVNDCLADDWEILQLL